MNVESFADIAYSLNPRVTGSITSVNTIAVSGINGIIELTFDIFQVLMTFAETRTPRQAFQMLDVDVSIDEFDRIVSELSERGLLKRESTDSNEKNLRDFLNPKFFSDPVLVAKVGRYLQAGHAVVVPDALPADFAEHVHGDLRRSHCWRAAEGHHDFFHYRNCVIDELEDRTSALTECCQIFKSSATRRFIADLSGRDCAGEAGVSAAWYRPGEYALPHDDSSAGNARSVAYVWYLAKRWNQEWGGSLFWCPTGQYISPGFNVLIIFNVMKTNIHFVCPVAPTATEQRLSINGFWHRSERSRSSASISPESVISPRLYGPACSIDPSLQQLIVL